MLIAMLSALLASAAPAPEVQVAALSPSRAPLIAAEDEDTGPVDSRAAAALQRMSRYLQSQHFLGLKARASSEQVVSSGEKIQLDYSLTIWVRQPDGLRVDVTSDRGLPAFSQFFFDGRTFTAVGATSGAYARVPVPPTLKGLTEKLVDDYGLRLPLVDLFTWAGGDEHLSRLTGAVSVGPTTVGEWPCDQYAFRQEGLDWQVWIQRGEQPLPRRIVMTATDEPARPRQSVEIDWLLQAPPAATVFAFEPPAGAREVPMPTSPDGAGRGAAAEGP